MEKIKVSLCIIAFLALSCDTPASVAPPASVDPPAAIDQYAPGVDCMKLGFDDRTYAPFGNYPSVAVSYNFHVYLKDPARYKDVETISIKTPKGVLWVVGKEKLTWNESRTRFDFYNYVIPAQEDYASLGDYVVTVSQPGKLDSEFTFKAYNNNDPMQNSGDVFSLGSQGIPKFATRPVNLQLTRPVGGNSLSITADSVDSRCYGLFIWIYDSAGEFIGGYDVAWPFTESQYANMALSQDLTADQASRAARVIVGVLAEKRLPEVSSTIMMYRYLHRFTL